MSHPLDRYFDDTGSIDAHPLDRYFESQGFEDQDYIQEKPQRSPLEKAARLPLQAAIGQAEFRALPYELSVAPLASKEAQQVEYRKNAFEDIERLLEQKQTGVWDAKDEQLLQHLTDQVKNPSKAEPFIQTADIGIRGLTEKATGLDLHPEGFLEKAAHWYGAIKDPRKIVNAAKEFAQVGIKPKDLLKIVSPGSDAWGSLGAAGGLQMAEEGQFGPLGTLASGITGFALGHGPLAIAHVVKNPKQTAAQAVNLFSRSNSNKAWTEQLLKDAKESGIQLDAGTIANSNLIRMAQARAAQSALSGKALDEFKKNLSGQIMREYGKVLEDLGETAFENNYQAAEAVKSFLGDNGEEIFLPSYRKEGASPSLQGRITTERVPAYQEELLNRISPREMPNSYQGGETLKTVAEDIRAPIKQEFNERWNQFDAQVENLAAEPHARLATDLNEFVENNQGSLLLGESTPESRVLQAATRLRDQLVHEDGSLIGVPLRDLIKTKRTLSDVADYEFGGSNFKSSYKKIVSDIDAAIERELARGNPQLLEEYQALNADYSNFKDLFENKNVLQLFEPKNNNYNSIYQSYVTNPDKLRALDDILYMSPRGQEVANQVKRDYAREMLSRPNLTEREIRDVSETLGPQFHDDIRRFNEAHRYAQENPRPRVLQQPRLGINAKLPEGQAAAPIKGAKETNAHQKRILAQQFKNKSSDQILKSMDTVEGIKHLRKILEATPEGKKLFDQLSRFKLNELIDKNLQNSTKENVKLGTFSGLLKNTENRAIVKELLGPEKFESLQRLQRNAGRLAESEQKFYNASKSGTTAGDMAAISGLAVGALTGNPFAIAGALSYIGGVKLAGYLFTDKQFLKYLEEAVLANNEGAFFKALEKMRPSVERALKADAISTKDQQQNIK